MHLKQAVRMALRGLVRSAPWGVRETLLEECIERIGVDAVRTRLFRTLNIVEVGVLGDRGVITGAWNDESVLRQYAQSGSFAAASMQEIMGFFGEAEGTYIDVGANIGLTVIPVARNPRIRCVAFEPEPANFDFLTRNVARNAPGAAVELRQAAVYREAATLVLATAESNHGDHRLAPVGGSPRPTVDVEAVPLDDCLGKLSGRVAVKVDTQGAEPFVIEGGRSVLDRTGLLLMEFCPFLMRQLGGDPRVVIDLVGQFDRVAVMAGDGAERPDYLAPGEAQSRLVRKLETAAPSDGDYLDIIARRD